MNPKKYKLVDSYEGYVIVGFYSTLQAAKQAADDFRRETDGECSLTLFRWSDTYSAYVTEMLFP